MSHDCLKVLRPNCSLIAHCPKRPLLLWSINLRKANGGFFGCIAGVIGLTGAVGGTIAGGCVA